MAIDDAYPPGHVTDLTVTIDDQGTQNLSLLLKWTAPGDELDSGTVRRYELKYSMEPADLLDGNFDALPYQLTEETVHAGSLTPMEAGSLQSVAFYLTEPQRDRPYYVGLRSIDKGVKLSPVSNLASFFIPLEDDEEVEELPALPQENEANFVLRHRSSSITYISLVVLTITGLVASLMVMMVNRIRVVPSETNKYTVLTA